MYNPLQFFKPVNARFDLAGQMATQISEQNRLRDARAKQQAGEQRFLGLQQLGQYQPEELQDPQVKGQMEQATMDMLGGGDKYLNYQLKQQQAEADALYRKQQLDAKNKGDAGTPKIAEYIGLQTDAIESAENVLQKYLVISATVAGIKRSKGALGNCCITSNTLPKLFNVYPRICLSG